MTDVKKTPNSIIGEAFEAVKAKGSYWRKIADSSPWGSDAKTKALETYGYFDAQWDLLRHLVGFTDKTGRVIPAWSLPHCLTTAVGSSPAMNALVSENESLKARLDKLEALVAKAK